MIRSRFVFSISLLLQLVLSIGCAPAQAKQPNIVFILTDDLNNGVFNHLTAIDDRIHRLIGAQGATFYNSFVSVAVCSPSRASIFRGQLAHNTGIYTNYSYDKFYADGLENSTVATWLQAAGYRTALIGNYFNTYPNPGAATHIPPGWIHWIVANGGWRYDQYNYSLNENGVTVSYGDAPGDYLVDVLSNKAAAFINDTVTRFPAKPFFLYISPTIPHHPATPPPRYAYNDMFPNVRAPRTASFNEADVSDKPAWIQSTPRLTSAQIGEMDYLYRNRLLSMKAVADLVENLINTLRAKGELANTYIFFGSDNGFHQGQHRIDSGKNTAYDEDLRVPLEVRGPGIAPGTLLGPIVANIDYAPTWADIAGVTPPEFVDGRSLLPLLRGSPPSNWRKALLLEHRSDFFFREAGATSDSKMFIGPPVNFVGLRTKDQAFAGVGPIAYVEYGSGEREYYDMVNDPNQLRNNYSEVSPVLKAKLHTWLGTMLHGAGKSLRDAEQTPP